MSRKKQVQKSYRRRQRDRKIERLKNVIAKLKERIARMNSRKTKKTTARREVVGELLTTKMELSSAQDEINSLEAKLARAEAQRKDYKAMYEAEKTVSKAAWAGLETAREHADKLRKTLYLAAVVIIALGTALGVVANT